MWPWTWSYWTKVNWWQQEGYMRIWILLSSIKLYTFAHVALWSSALKERCLLPVLLTLSFVMTNTTGIWMLQDFSRKCMQNADKTFAPLSYGRTLFVGDSVRQREELTARAFDVCIIVEGDRLQHELQAFLFSICIRQFSLSLIHIWRCRRRG